MIQTDYMVVLKTWHTLHSPSTHYCNVSYLQPSCQTLPPNASTYVLLSTHSKQQIFFSTWNSFLKTTVSLESESLPSSIRLLSIFGCNFVLKFFTFPDCDLKTWTADSPPLNPSLNYFFRLGNSKCFAENALLNLVTLVICKQ